jgi:quercetin dioxygenase-like cupin family protein
MAEAGRKGFQIFRAVDAPELGESGIGSHPEAASPEIAERLRSSGIAKGVVATVPFRQEGPEGVSLVSVFFKPGYHSTRHSHNADCLYYIKSGEARLGNQVLKAGDGFFVPADSPYQFQAGPEGFELLEFRTATSYNQKLLEDDLERWQPVFEAAEANRELWESIDGPQHSS